MLGPTQPPARGDVALDVAMMNNEYRSAAFNLSNATASPVRIRLRVEGLPGGVDPPYVRVYEVPFTDTRSGVPVAAASFRPPGTKVSTRSICRPDSLARSGFQSPDRC